MTTDTSEIVAYTLENKVGVVTLNNPSRLNALSHALIEAAIAALEDLERRGAHVVVLRAAPGMKVFSAGHDINELPTGRRDPLGHQDPLERLLRAVQDHPVPVIGMIGGSVWGGACDLCICCDIIICAEHVTFAMTPAKLGVPYNASGLARFLYALGPHKAKEMFFTAGSITAYDLENVRMVNHVVPADALEAFTFEMAAAIAKNAPLAVRVIKRQFRLLLKGQMLSAETFEMIQSIRREVYDSDDYAEGIQAFKEKRKPVFKGC